MCRTTGRACSLAGTFELSELSLSDLTLSWYHLFVTDFDRLRFGSTHEFSIMLRVCWHSQRREMILKASSILTKFEGGG
jgi:hypothetical protein